MEVFQRPRKNTKTETNEKVPFRLFHMPCCGQLLCWVNPRLPNFCPECGAKVYSELQHGQNLILSDDNAWLKVHE